MGASAVFMTAALVGCSGSDSSDPAPSAEADASTTTITAAPLERYADAESEVYADLANWVCHPDADDICDDGLDATVVEEDGTLTEEPWTADPDAPIDCFYVYPTISADETQYSDREAGDEERFVTLNQAARLGEVCRVVAPVYRQRTLAGLAGAIGGETTTSSAEPPPPYPDVLEAFRHYMATENDGRGVVLIGHSQGAGLLNRLLAEEVDPNDDVRAQLVSAYLAGAAVRVPQGEDVGGDFENVPLCRAEDQVGCVVSWASFSATVPPGDDALFGRPRDGEGVAACNSPASLSGGSAEVHSYFPSSPSASILGASGDATEWVRDEELTTPFVTTPGLVSAECVSRGGFDYLEVTVHGDPSTPRADAIGGELGSGWGLHLQDVNLVMGDIVELVGTQSESWADQRG
jgi:hypothetical protein